MEGPRAWGWKWEMGMGVVRTMMMKIMGNMNHMAWDAEAMAFLFLGKAWASWAESMHPRKNCLRKPLFSMSPTFGFCFI